MFRGGLAKVRAELEPWEKQLIEHKGKLDVALLRLLLGSCNELGQVLVVLG